MAKSKKPAASEQETMRTSARLRAIMAARSLFINGSNETASRLELRQPGPDGKERALGGWCEDAVRDRLEAHIYNAMRAVGVEARRARARKARKV